jgi:hypothetical protein
MQKAKFKIADSEFYIFHFAFLIVRTRPLPQAVLTVFSFPQAKL